MTQNRSVPGGFRSEQSDDALLELLGERLARARLQRNWSQAELAREAGVSRATVQRLEAGSSTQLTNWLRVLRALDLVERLEAVLPPPTLRPLEALERDGGRRRRASPRSRRDHDEPWSWGAR